VTYEQFEAYGIDRHCIGPAIREAVALGFLIIKRAGRAGNAEFRQAALYQLTYLTTQDDEPTHDWQRIKTIEQAHASLLKHGCTITAKTGSQCANPPLLSV